MIQDIKALMQSFVQHAQSDAPDSDSLLLSRIAALDAENECLRLANVRLREENRRIQVQLDQLQERADFLFQTIRVLRNLCQDENILD